MVEGTQPIEHNDATATVASSNTGLCPSLGQALQRVRYTAAPLVSSSSSEAALKAEPLSVAVPPCSVPFIFAHRQWRAGLLMADAIQQGAFPVTGKRVLELGAGTALPSLASWRKGAGFTLATDYDAEPLVDQLKLNVTNNVPRGAPEAKRIKAMGYTWGVASDDVLDELPSLKPMGTASGFDVILTADCMWDQLSHASLISAFRALLARSADSRVYVVAGLHTGRDAIYGCLRRAHKTGLVLRELPHHEEWPKLPAGTELPSSKRSADDPLRDSQYILELALRDDGERAGVQVEEGAEIQAQGPWLSGERRLFVEQERPEERKEVGGVKVRNGWITIWSLGWSDEQLKRS